MIKSVKYKKKKKKVIYLVVALHMWTDPQVHHTIDWQREMGPWMISVRGVLQGTKTKQITLQIKYHFFLLTFKF